MMAAMKHLLTKILPAIILVLFLSGNHASAGIDKLIHFDLSLAGYSLGMTYNDAAAIRPLFLMQSSEPALPDMHEDYFDVVVENVYVDGIEMNLWMRFKNERLYKIIARFNPEMTDSLAGTFNRALGQGEDKSKSYQDRDGSIIQQTVYFWDYPTAKLYLVKNTDNMDYATVGLTAKPAYAESFSEEGLF